MSEKHLYEVVGDKGTTETVVASTTAELEEKIQKALPEGEKAVSARATDANSQA